MDVPMDVPNEKQPVRSNKIKTEIYFRPPIGTSCTRAGCPRDLSPTSAGWSSDFHLIVSFK